MEERINFDGYYYFNSDFVNELIVINEYKNFDEIRSYMIKNKITTLSLAYTRLTKDNPSNLDFLKEFGFVRRLVLGIDNEEIDIEGIYFLDKLESLSINQPYRNVLNLSIFPQLEKFNTEYWKSKYNELFDLSNIEDLTIKGYKGKDLSKFAKLTNLKWLELVGGSIESLKGLENLPSLKRLGVYYCRKIINLDFLPSNIEKLTLQNLPNLNEIRGLSVVKMLSFLKIEGCKDIDSIQVLNDLEKLKEVRIITNTKIIDGDMSSLIKIEKVIFRDYKYYTHLNENFKAVENKKRVTT